MFYEAQGYSRTGRGEYISLLSLKFMQGCVNMTLYDALILTYDYAVECYGEKPKLLEAYENDDNYDFFYIWNTYSGEILIGPGY